ncbi:MAG: hypothetical protein JRI25_13400, partial [Deltaproteobacteria bacterium]|nr:hypothetical protein [Deltaproteobacteria bacterium]
GVADPEVFGVDHLIYRVQGPGPMSLNPPPGIDFFLGDLSRVQVIHPLTGEILESRDFNAGLFQNFAATDPAGNVVVQDIGRIQKFDQGLRERLWITDLTSEVGEALLEATPAGSIGFTPDGSIVLPFLSGDIFVLDPVDGAVLSHIQLTHLDPPVAADPQYGSGTYLRNAVAMDGDRLFFLVQGEMVVMDHRPTDHRLEVVDRAAYTGFSSSTPTLDTAGRRLFLVSFEPDQPQRAPMLRCFDYASLPMSEKWAVEAEIAVLDSEDQLTSTLVGDDLLVNNALYGSVSAYQIRSDGSGADLLWDAKDTVGGEPMMYIASASNDDRMLYVFDNATRTLYGLAADTGEVRWTYPITAQSIKKPIPYRGTVLLDHNEGLVSLVAD